MRRLGVLSLIVGSLMAMTVTTATAQSGGPTLGQLQRALLSEDDFFFELDEYETGNLDRRYPAVYGDYYLIFDEFLSVELHDARNGTPENIAIDFLNDFDIFEVTRIAPTGFGRDGVRFRYDYFEDGEHWYGEVAAWQQGQVVVAILYESYVDPEICVCDYAELQFDKVAAIIG
jgi:hypothetical protein